MVFCPRDNEKADELVKASADQPHEHGVEWLTHQQPAETMPPVSLAHLSRQAAEEKWEEAKGWVKCRQWRKNRPDPEPAKAQKGTASRYYQLKTGHALTSLYLQWIGSREGDTC